MFKTALVTGATSGIGEALSHLLAEHHINLVITGRDENKLHTLSKKLSEKVNVISFKANLVLSEERRKVEEAIWQHAPDLIINSAGIGLYGEIFNQSTEEQMGVMNLNGDALLQITLEGAKMLREKKKKGVILNVSSAASILPFPYFSIYSATKAFVNQLSVSLDEELKGYGIRVLSACPGMVKTQFRQRAAKTDQVSTSTHSMTPREAAEHIWWQISKKKPLYIFNWRYRLSIMFSKYLIPQSILTKLFKKEIGKL